jgi:F0F1-type ATP synthase membrane subunit c/vacuolar-type H+-ATPase subunit K
VPVLLVLLLALVGAGLLGWMGQTTTDGAFRGSWEFSRLGGPWLVAGFLGGAVGGWRRGPGGLVLGVLAGAVIVGAGSVAYYGLSYWDGGNDARRAAKLGIGWGAAGLGVGGVLGLVGAAYATRIARTRREDGRLAGSWLHGLALGTLGGLLMGESIALLWVWDEGGLRSMAVLEGLGGAALVAFGAAARPWRFIVGAVLASAVAATVAPIATTVLRETLRTIGWAGA